MPRLTLVLSVVVLFGLVATWDLRATAQEATPATGPVGVTATVLGSGQPAMAPGYDLSLCRITIEPGGRLPAHTHPGALVIYLESGT